MEILSYNYMAIEGTISMTFKVYTSSLIYQFETNYSDIQNTPYIGYICVKMKNF